MNRSRPERFGTTNALLVVAVGVTAGFALSGSVRSHVMPARRPHQPNILPPAAEPSMNQRRGDSQDRPVLSVPEQDVDGVTMHSFAAMALGMPGLQSCTPGGIIRLLDAYDVELAGRHAVVVIGRSLILDRPLGVLLLARNATVTYCHSRTLDVAHFVADADIVIAAVGKPRFVQGEWLKPGAVVIDAGYNPGNIGDVDFEAAAPVASLITPVPGGVGPMTIAVLLQQTVEEAEASL